MHLNYFEIDDSDTGQILFRPNHFPNYFEEGIHHDLLWVLGGKFEFDEEFVKAEVAKHIPAQREYLWGVTPSHGRSVPTLAHCHIFSRIPPNAS